MEAEIFKEEALELLEDIEETLLELGKQPQDAKLINRLFRAVHTIKGSGAMFGFNEIAGFSHKFENAIDAVRQGRISLHEQALNTFLEARDQILSLLNTNEPDAEEIKKRSAGIVESLAALESTASVSPPPVPAAQAVPAAPAGQQAGAKEPQSQKGLAVAALDLPPLKTLIVEDEFVSRYIMQEFLFSLGICHIAINGFEAVLAVKRSLVEKRPYDLVCLDIMMPGMDGRDVAREVRRLESEFAVDRRCRIIMTTAVSDEKVIQELYQQKLCDAYLVKPIAREMLFETIKKIFVQS